MLIMTIFFVSDRHTRKKIPSSSNRSRTYDLPAAGSDALALSNVHVALSI